MPSRPTPSVSPPSTAQKILDLLNRQPLSVSELASRLEISRNSTYVQLAKLEAAGAVEKTALEPTGRVGKPAVGYRTTARHEDTFSTAYKPVLASLLDILGSRLPSADQRDLLNAAGRHLAKASGLKPSGDFAVDLRRALDAVNDLGAFAEIDDSTSEPGIRCHSCPLATAVHQNPSICRLVASFFAEATARSVTSHCHHGETVVCGFSFGSSESNR